MPTPNWPYIAGFFDGEGNVRKTKKDTVKGKRGPYGTPMISIAQSIRGDGVLQRISDFLHRHHIVNHIMNERHWNPKWKPVQRLHVSALPSVRKFLRGVRPYLIVKREAVDVELQYIASRKWRRFIVPQELVLKAIQAYASGLSLRQVSLKFHIDNHTVRKYMKVYGYKTRTKSEGISLRLKGRTSAWRRSKGKKAWRTRRSSLPQ